MRGIEEEFVLFSFLLSDSVRVFREVSRMFAKSEFCGMELVVYVRDSSVSHTCVPVVGLRAATGCAVMSCSNSWGCP